MMVIGPEAFGICRLEASGPPPVATIVAASTLPAAIDTVLPSIAPSLGSGIRLVLPTRHPSPSTASDLVTPFRSALATAGLTVEVVRPAGLSPRYWSSTGRALGEWREVPLAPDSLFPRATLPSRLVDSDNLVLLNDLRDEKELRPVIALGVWKRYLHPKQRLLVELASHRTPVDAEIAAVIRPAATVLAASGNSYALLIFTADPLAAELIGLAIHWATSFSEAETTGPWEDAIVQRATELGSEIRLPRDLSLEWRRAEEPAAPDPELFASLARRVEQRLGIPSSQIH